jgi:dinuclear metal center YbgI/SA1388 family protein
MSVAIEDVVSLIEAIAPKELAYEWDNTGLLVQCCQRVSKVLIALDVTQEVVDEALQSGCDMILSHHPLIMTPMDSVSIQRPGDSVLMSLVKNGISLYCAHTSHDKAKGGINDILAERLGLTNVEIADCDPEAILRVGILPYTMSSQQLTAHVKEAISVDYIKTSLTKTNAISKVAVLGGSGGDFVATAKKARAEALITGQAKHQHYLEANALGVLLIEAGHFETEQFFTDAVFSGLQARLNEVQLHLGLKKAEQQSVPYKII